MSFANFKPTVWSAALERDREKLLTALTICNRQYEGEIKQCGDKVKIVGVGRPTIAPYDQNTGLGDPEVVDGGSTMLEITQADKFNFMVDDIDRRQSVGDLVAAERQEAAAGMAEAIDSFIYGLYGDAGSKKTAENLTSANIMSTVAEALQKLYEANVPSTEMIYLEVSPAFATKLMLAKVVHQTDNMKMMENGIVGNLKMFNVEVRRSSNIKKVGGKDQIFMRTKKAIAAATAFSKVEPYRPEKFFADAVKGLQLYGAKVIRPKELVVISASYAAETTI